MVRAWLRGDNPCGEVWLRVFFAATTSRLAVRLSERLFEVFTFRLALLKRFPPPVIQEKLEQPLVLEELRDHFVTLARHNDQLRRTTECLIAFDQFGTVWPKRNSDVPVAMEVQNRDTSSGQQRESQHRIVFGQLYAKLRFGQFVLVI